MFVEYKILDDEKEKLRLLSKDEFEEYPEIEGQFMIAIGNYVLGYVDDNVPVGNELLMYWFDEFVQSAIYLKEYGYAIFCAIDFNNIWLEFTVSGNRLIFNEKRKVVSCVNFLISKCKQPCFEDSNNIESLNIEINSNQFYQQIIFKTKQFLQGICSISDILMKTEPVKKLIKNVEYLEHITLLS